MDHKELDTTEQLTLHLILISCDEVILKSGEPLIQCDGVLIKAGHLATEREPWEEGAETGGRSPQAKVCLGLPEAGTGKEGSSPLAFGGSLAQSTSCLQACGLQNCERRHFHCSKPRRLWCFVTMGLVS